MSNELSFILIASFGALCMEAIYWIELRRGISDKERAILTSKFYWILTFLMILISGIGTKILFYDKEMLPRVPFMLGAAFPAIFKKVVSLAQDKLPDLGNRITFKKAAKIYFQ